jgi:hypothetical protein
VQFDSPGAPVCEGSGPVENASTGESFNPMTTNNAQHSPMIESLNSLFGIRSFLPFGDLFKVSRILVLGLIMNEVMFQALRARGYYLKCSSANLAAYSIHCQERSEPQSRGCPSKFCARLPGRIFPIDMTDEEACFNAQPILFPNASSGLRKNVTDTPEPPLTSLLAPDKT